LAQWVPFVAPDALAWTLELCRPLERRRVALLAGPRQKASVLLPVKKFSFQLLVGYSIF
jgi:hypothetical protein